MKIIKLSNNPLAEVVVSGSVVKIVYNGTEKEFNMKDYQQDTVTSLDIVEENGDWGIGNPANCKYIASIIIPAKEYELAQTGETDQDGNPVFGNFP